MGEIASNSNLYDALAECEVVRTALTMFQRFYWKHRMQSNCIWEVALASIILSSKASERPLPLRTCILLLHRVWLVRVNHGSPAPLPTTTLKPHDEHYLRWKARAIEVEGLMLMTLGFTLYPISFNHPHRYIKPICSGLSAGQGTIERAWAFANDSLLLDLAVRYEPNVIALSCVKLAGMVEGSLPGEWHEVFFKDGEKLKAFNDCCNSILGIYGEGGVMESETVTKGYLDPINKNSKIFAD